MGSWALLIFVASSMPASRLPRLDVNMLDKWVHAAVFLVLGFLAARAAAASFPGLGRAAVLLGCGLSLLYGGLDEFHQMFVPGRFASGYDWLADALGTFLGAALYLGWRRRQVAPLEGRLVT